MVQAAINLVVARRFSSESKQRTRYRGWPKGTKWWGRTPGPSGPRHLRLDSNSNTQFFVHLRLALAVKPSGDWCKPALCTRRLQSWLFPYMLEDYAESVASIRK
jgi:hypothetical protein